MYIYMDMAIDIDEDIYVDIDRWIDG